MNVAKSYQTKMLDKIKRRKVLMDIIRAESMVSSSGNKVVDQFILKGKNVCFFQSYGSIIVKEELGPVRKITLDERCWDYSKTTGKYRNQFLGETKAETQKKIDSGEYTLADLNQ